MSELPRPAEPMQSGWLSRSLTFIERVGNALPHPGTLFALMALLVIVVSAITAQFDLVVEHAAWQLRHVSFPAIALMAAAKNMLQGAVCDVVQPSVPSCSRCVLTLLTVRTSCTSDLHRRARPAVSA